MRARLAAIARRRTADRKVVATGLRFALVGALATTQYCLVSLLLTSRFVGLAIGWASLASFVVSLTASYVGHAAFTFRVGKHVHGRTGPRYFVAAIGLAISCSLLAQLIVSRLGVPEVYVTAFITVLYPAASFLIHSAWSFNAAR
jgi:putative flippase GtrA